MPATRRMISYAVYTEEKFLNLSAGAVRLYVYLNLYADNSGIVPATAAMRVIEATEKELEELIQTGYVMKAYGNRYIITHWLIHNSKPKAGSKPTEYPMDLALFELDEKSKAYRKFPQISENSPQISENFPPKGEENRREENRREETIREETIREKTIREEFEEGEHAISQYIKTYCAEKSYKLEDGQLEALISYIQGVKKVKKLEIPDINSIIDKHFSVSSQK